MFKVEEKYMAYSDWEPIIGLEIHAQLNTASKLFSSDANRFGDAPNSNISELSVALPGSLPVLNKEAVRKAVLFGLAVSGDVQLVSRFDRKSYFYPDCPRNYQITQYDHPLIRGGCVRALVQGIEKQFQINRIQLEDDAGMLKHFSQFAGVDFNRSGVPLIEIVSEPCMHSAQDAVAYAMAIRSILDYLDVSDCNMEEGSIRFDVNVSVRKKGETGLRNRIEIKNMNSFSNLEEAINHEIERQIEIYEKDPVTPHKQLVLQSTYRWDQETLKTVLMRSKEDAEDYRYFPDPDLLPLVLTKTEVQELQKKVPELPLEKEKRYIHELGLSELQSYFLTSNKKMATFFEEALQYCSEPKHVANWIAVEFTGRLKEQGMAIYESAITPKAVGQLVHMLVVSKEITGPSAKFVADKMVLHPNLSPQEIVQAHPHLKPVHDKEFISNIAEKVVLANGPTVQEYLKGRDRVFAFLVGQVMKETKGSASPDAVNSALKDAIERHYK